MTSDLVALMPTQAPPRATPAKPLAAARAAAPHRKPPTALYRARIHTTEKHPIPIQPSLDLIDAFEQDQRVTLYETFEQLVEYCRRSANPVGRLVLYVCGYSDEQRQHLSDF